MKPPPRRVKAAGSWVRLDAADLDAADAIAAEAGVSRSDVLRESFRECIGREKRADRYAGLRARLEDIALPPPLPDAQRCVLMLVDAVGGHTALGRLVGRSPSTVHRWSRGDVEPDAAMHARLAELANEYA